MKKTIDLEGLKAFLETLKYADFETAHNRPENPAVREGFEVASITEAKKAKITLDRAINPGDYFLVDALGNDISLCISARRGYKLPDGRVIKAKLVATLISDCRAVYGTPLNNVWMVPERFIL